MGAIWKDYAKNFEHKPIGFEKVDDTYAKIFYNGDRVGHIENHITHFVVEVYLYRITIGKKNKKHVKRFIRDYSAWHQYQQYNFEAAERRGMKIQG
jgi:methyltransferase-like protein